MWEFSVFHTSDSSLRKLMVIWALKKSRPFRGKMRAVTVLYIHSHWAQFWAKWISVYILKIYFLFIPININPPSPPITPANIFYYSLVSLTYCLCCFSPSFFNFIIPVTVRWIIIMKLRITWFSPSSCCSLCRSSCVLLSTLFFSVIQNTFNVCSAFTCRDEDLRPCKQPENY